jgi:tetratricopeptide (TPR) repeat protein
MARRPTRLDEKENSRPQNTMSNKGQQNRQWVWLALGATLLVAALVSPVWTRASRTGDKPDNRAMEPGLQESGAPATDEDESATLRTKSHQRTPNPNLLSKSPFFRGSIYFEDGDIDRARAEYEKAISYGVDVGKSHKNLALLLLSGEDSIPEAKRDLEAAISHGIDDAQTHGLLDCGEGSDWTRGVFYP